VVKLKEIHKKTSFPVVKLKENQPYWGKTISAYLVLPNLVLFPKKAAHYSSFYHQNWHISLVTPK